MIYIANGVVERAKLISASVGMLGMVGCTAGWIFAPGDFFLSYLFAHFFFLGLSLGALGLLMIHHLTGGYWGYSVRGFFESALGNLPLLAGLFVPLFFGLAFLYSWKNRFVLAPDEILRSRFNYLNTPGYVMRPIIVFAVWI